MHLIETLSKRAAMASALAIVAIQLVAHPDLTWTLRVAAIVACLAGWVAARYRWRIQAVWVLVAPFAPALLRAATGREGPVLDFPWMAGLTVALVATASPSRWNLPDGWRALASGWALTVLLAWPILAGREIAFDPALLRDQGAINSWGMLSAPQSAEWILYVAWMHLLGLLWLDWVCAELSTEVLHALWIGATVGSLVGIYQGTVNLNTLSTPFWAGNARATGTMLDANAFGMCAAIAGPIAFALLHDRAIVAATAVLVVNLAAVWMSGSRNAALCAGVSLIAVALAVWKSAAPTARRTFGMTAAGAAVVLAILVFVSGVAGPARRLAELPHQPLDALAEVWNRGPYGVTSARIVRDYPLAGVGVGSYQIIAPDYWRTIADNPLPFDTAQNWWRHQAAEFGLIGGLTLFVWSAILTWTIVAARARGESRVASTVVRGVLVGLGLTSLTHMPTQTPLVLLWFLTLSAWFVLRLTAPMRLPAVLTSRAVWVGAFVVALLYATAHIVLARGALSVEARAMRSHREYVVGAYPPEALPDSTTFRWTRKEARFVLPERTSWMVLRIWSSHPDVKQHPVGISLSSSCGELFHRQLTSAMPIEVGVILPKGSGTFDGRVTVSRTWSPAEYGSPDTRTLGVAVIPDFVDQPARATGRDYVLHWRECRPTK